MIVEAKTRSPLTFVHGIQVFLGELFNGTEVKELGACAGLSHISAAREPKKLLQATYVTRARKVVDSYSLIVRNWSLSGGAEFHVMETVIRL